MTIGRNDYQERAVLVDTVEVEAQSEVEQAHGLPSAAGRRIRWWERQLPTSQPTNKHWRVQP